MKAFANAVVVPVVLLVVFGASMALAQKSSDATPPREEVLKAAEVGGKLFPDKVFFKSQVASVQARNSAGARYSDGSLTLAALVDASGYASGLKEKYQGYLLSDVAIEIGGQTLKPGAYGFGFIEGNKLVVMDLGANDLFQASSTKDADLKHPVPFQIVAGSSAGSYRMYKGREYVEFHRAK
jgi:hypothetical protein